jgi:hypothetical protein
MKWRRAQLPPPVGVVGAEDLYHRPQPERGLDRDLSKVVHRQLPEIVGHP